MDSPKPALKITLPCKCMRSKEMYYESPGQEEDDFSSGIFWCTETQESFGPDGESVGKEDCHKGRKCYTT